MKYCILSILSIFLSSQTFSQSSKTTNLLNSIEGMYEVDDSGNISYVRIFDNLGISENQIYDRALSYFVYKYNDSNSVIQEKNEEAGRIIGKGIFSNVHTGSGLVTRVYSVVHILRIDIRENRARAVITLSQYNITSYDLDGNSSIATSHIAANYPFNPSGKEKNFNGQAFYNAHLKVMDSFSELERVLKEGVIFSDLDDDW
jgi:hypothetical protein